MNTYLVVEGKKNEKYIYEKWIKLLDNQVSIVYKPEDVTENSVLIISGDGYPAYFEIIRAASEDILEFNTFDRLVVAVDSEDYSYVEKYEEIDAFISQINLKVPYEILIQHFCIETWLLANRKIYSRGPQNRVLRTYQKKYNVAKYDPELLPRHEEENINRATFASKYLNLLLKEKYSHLGYRKRAPQLVCDSKYFNQIIKRHKEKKHIKSFGFFLKYFNKN